MGKLDGKVAVITGGSTGMALAGAKLFADEGARVFITGRRQGALDEAVRLIGPNVTAVQATPPTWTTWTACTHGQAGNGLDRRALGKRWDG